MEWKPIKTAPKDGTLIIIKEECGRMQFAKWCFHENRADWYVQLTQIFTDYYPTTNVTHWMPSPPKE